jgi:hypothetical protein
MGYLRKRERQRKKLPERRSIGAEMRSSQLNNLATTAENLIKNCNFVIQNLGGEKEVS